MTTDLKAGPGRTRPGAAHRSAAAGRRRLLMAPDPGLLRFAQVIPVALLLWGLDLVDRFRAGAQAAGLADARAVNAVSRELGGAVTVQMNDWLQAHWLLAAIASGYYVIAHGLVTGVIGLVLLYRRVPSFRLHRNALIAGTAIGLATFWLYPVAPPRMLAGYHDIAGTAVPLFSSLLNSKAADQFASLPSLHVTWALWVAVAASALVRQPALRVAVWIYPALTVLDVLATANHYLLDVIVAPGVVVLAYAAAALSLLAWRRVRPPAAWQEPAQYGPAGRAAGGRPPDKAPAPADAR